MCGCFGDVCTCIYCVFVLFRLCVFILFYAFVWFCKLCIFDCYVYISLLLRMLCSVYSVFIVLAGTLQLPWLRFFRAFSSLVRQMSGYNSQRRGTARKVNVKKPHYRPGQALRVPWGWGSQISGQSAHEGGKVVSPTHRPPLPPGNISGTHFC